MASGLKFRIYKVEGSYYLCSENKDADQLRGHREADLRLCFRICKKPVFSRRGSIVIGVSPNSPYNMNDGVDLFSVKISFKNFKRIRSLISLFPNPHSSQPYKRIGLMVLSNKSDCTPYDRFKDRIFFSREKIHRRELDVNDEPGKQELNCQGN